MSQLDGITKVYSLVVINHVSMSLNPIVKALQKYGSNILNSINQLENLLEVLSKSSNQYMRLYTTAKDFNESVGGNFFFQIRIQKC